MLSLIVGAAVLAVLMAVEVDPVPNRIDVSFAPTVGYFLGIF